MTVCWPLRETGWVSPERWVGQEEHWLRCGSRATNWVRYECGLSSQNHYARLEGSLLCQLLELTVWLLCWRTALFRGLWPAFLRYTPRSMQDGAAGSRCPTFLSAAHSLDDSTCDQRKIGRCEFGERPGGLTVSRRWLCCQVGNTAEEGRRMESPTFPPSKFTWWGERKGNAKRFTL